ncbi:MAG: RNA 2',3'-cyclic phosphodiesterase [Thermoplasmata archaeon]|nr:MAG: RNA 2',3'-cyclic phosphodiesterase [Thermoplasmata archaeon]
MRMFIAIDIGEREEIVDIEKKLEKIQGKIKLVEPWNVHLTLKFLGETEEELIPKIKEVMEKSVENVSPFSCSLIGIGAFPSMNYVRVIWMGLEDKGETKHIAQRLEEGLEVHGFKRERRKFTPHITIARVKSIKEKQEMKEFLQEHANTSFGKVDVNSIVLKKSELRKEGPVYETLVEVKL